MWATGYNWASSAKILWLFFSMTTSWLTWGRVMPLLSRGCMALVLDKWAYWRKKQNWRRNKDKVYEVIDQISALSNCLTVMAKMTRTLSEGWVKSKVKKYYSFSVIPEPGFEFCSPIQFWCRVKNSNGENWKVSKLLTIYFKLYEKI